MPAFRPALISVLRPPFRLATKILFRFEVRHAERFPVNGPLLVAANHASYLDPILLATGAPRPLRFMMLRSFHEKPVLGFLSSLGGAFPVDSEKPTASFLRTATRILEEGGAVAIFPEGGRSRNGKLQPGKPGAMLLALRSRVPVLPALIGGAFDAWPPSRRYPLPRKITVTWGEPFTGHLAYRYPEDKDRLPELTGLLMERIAGLR